MGSCSLTPTLPHPCLAFPLPFSMDIYNLIQAAESSGEFGQPHDRFRRQASTAVKRLQPCWADTPCHLQLEGGTAAYARACK